MMFSVQHDLFRVSKGQRTIKVRISGKVLQVREILVVDLICALKMSIFLSVGHIMTFNFVTVLVLCRGGRGKI